MPRTGATAPRRQSTSAPRSRRRQPDLVVVPANGRARRKPEVDERTRTYAVCRSLGHAWQHLGYADNANGRGWTTGAFGYVSSCSCGTRRTRYYTRSGDRAGSPRYEYPDGYSQHGDDRLTLKEWRHTWITSVLGDGR